jgi:hypothetical protein
MDMEENSSHSSEVLPYSRDCNRRFLSEVKNLMIRLSRGSMLLATCFFMANLKSSFTPLSVPRVEILRWLKKNINSIT